MDLYSRILFLFPLPLFYAFSSLPSFPFPSSSLLHTLSLFPPCNNVARMFFDLSVKLYTLKFYTLVCDSEKLMIVARVVVLLSFRGMFLNLT